ncbi:MAG: family 1 encapsulin nanocompartment shell protein [Thermoanaerobacteraceae bacterium]|nr:family 1 encapsulin nanocompartment shell protein [Thermoanaerobacteraceae bacterium]
MADYLSREASPFSTEQWAAIDQAAVNAAKSVLVGRKFIPLFGPVGPGTFVVPKDKLVEGEGDIIGSSGKTFIPLNTIYRDFVYPWRDIQYYEENNLPLDLTRASYAATLLAAEEDKLLFYGDDTRGIEGILNAAGRLQYSISDWQEGSAYDDVVNALALLRSKYMFGPYVLVVSPALNTALNKVYKDTPYLDSERIEKLGVKIYTSPVLKDNDGFIVSTGSQNMDLVVGQDMITSFLETTDMNHYFRVFEILGLRVKNSESIVALTYKKEV